MKVHLSAAVLLATVVSIACQNSPTGPLDSPGSLRFSKGWTDYGCRAGDQLIPVGPDNPYDGNDDLSVCSSTDGYYDNRIPNDGNGGGWVDGCRAGDYWIGVQYPNEYDKNGDLAVCVGDKGYYDNRLDGNSGGNGGGWVDGCRAGDYWIGVQYPNEYDKNGDLAVCVGDNGYYDNRLPNR